MARKSEKINDIFTKIQRDYGLDTTFFQRKLGMKRSTFFAARVRGFYPKEVETLDMAFREIGAVLLATRVPDYMHRVDTRWEREKE